MDGLRSLGLIGRRTKHPVTPPTDHPRIRNRSRSDIVCATEPDRTDFAACRQPPPPDRIGQPFRDSWVIRRPTVPTVSSCRVGTVPDAAYRHRPINRESEMKNHLGVDPRLPGVRIDLVPEPRVAANDDNGEAARLALVANFVARYPDRFVGTEAIVSGCTLIGLWFVACIVFATFFDAGIVA
jgi:hypothetical protein